MSFENLRATSEQNVVTAAQRALLHAFQRESKSGYEAVKEKLSRALNLSTEETNALFKQLIIFLWLHAIKPTDRKLCPSQRIDAAWHQFLAFTFEYQEFCKAVGGFIHHTPFTSHNEARFASLSRWFTTLGEVKCFIGQDVIIDKWWYDKLHAVPVRDDEKFPSDGNCG
jgi:hypothetical protein